MGRNDQGLIADLEHVKGLRGVLHRGPVRLAAHNDRDRFCRHCAPTFRTSPRKEARDYRLRPPAGKAKAVWSCVKRNKLVKDRSWPQTSPMQAAIWRSRRR